MTRVSDEPKAGHFLGLVAILGFCECQAAREPRLPPPVYEKPSLPEWAPKKDAAGEDPFLDPTALEGEWVPDDEVSEEGAHPEGETTPVEQSDPAAPGDDAVEMPEELDDSDETKEDERPES